MPNSREVVYYHNDADGHCSAAIWKYHHELQKGSTELVLREINHGYKQEELFDGLQTTDHVVFLDMRPTDLDFGSLGEHVETVLIIDHHKTTQSMLTGFENTAHYPALDYALQNSVVDTTKAASELVWEYCFKGTNIPRSVWLVSKYDMWQHDEDERIVQFATGLKLLITDPNTEDGYEFWKYTFENSEDIPAQLSPEEKANRMRWDVVFQVINMGQVAQMYRTSVAEGKEKYLHDMVIDGKKFLMLNDKLNDSYDFPLPKDMEGYFGYGWYFYTGDSWVFSLRSTGENDVANIAGAHSGGGHKNAAGFHMWGFPDPDIYIRAAKEQKEEELESN